MQHVTIICNKLHDAPIERRKWLRTEALVMLLLCSSVDGVLLRVSGIYVADGAKQAARGGRLFIDC